MVQPERMTVQKNELHLMKWEKQFGAKSYMLWRDSNNGDAGNDTASSNRRSLQGRELYGFH